MSINAASFKILVGSFTDKNVLASGNALTIYQIGSIDYKLTTILESVDSINEFYEEGGNNSNPCTSNLFGCTESLVVNVDPVCPTGTGGSGPAGPQGPQGPSGSNGTNARTMIIQMAQVELLDCGEDPTSRISDPVDNSDGVTRTQTLTLGIPVSCPGGGGGGNLAVKVTRTGGDVFNSGSTSAIDFKSGGNMSFGAAVSGGTTGNINIISNCTAVGKFKIQSVKLETSGPLSGRWIYKGLPQKFMVDSNGGDSFADDNFVLDVDAEEVVNIAEDSSSTSIPLGAPISLDYQDSPFGLIYPNPTAVPTIQEIVALYKHSNGELFINTKNPLNGNLLKAKIDSVDIFASTSGPKWRYKVKFCSVNSTITSATGPTTTPINFQSNSAAWAYNQLEVGNTISSAYGYTLSTSNPYTAATGTTPEGFKLNSTTGFLFSHVPIGSIVDIEVDSKGNFYFKAPNAVVGICT
jgi:hypothetical protein